MQFLKTVKSKGKAVLDRELIKLHSIYVRLRDSDSNGNCQCITCTTTLPWKQMQAGHWQDRGKLGTRFNDQNVNGQCGECNGKFGGRGDVYRIALQKKWGLGTAGNLEELANDRHFRIERGEYLQKIEHYKTQISALKRKKPRL